MPMLRTGSARSTLSMMQRRATKYQRYLNMSNVFLLTTSTILIFVAIVLIKFYHINKLDFWSAYFMIVPVLMMALGIYTFLVCLFGFLISGSERRSLLATYAVLLGIAFLAQLASLFTALELRTTVAGPQVGAGVINEALSDYGIDSGVTSQWDELQSNMQCCGGSNFGSGYNDYRNTAIGRNNSVPDSCCLTINEGCGQGIFSKSPAEIQNRIFVHGCVTLLQRRLEYDVIPAMIAYAVIGVVLAIIELITVVLACAYVAQITRKIQREDNMWRHGTADHDGVGGDATDALNRDHETVC